MKALNLKIIAAVFVLFCCPQIKAQNDKRGFSLVQNKPVEQEIVAGQTHSYEIKTDKEKFLHFVIDQKSADVAVAMYFAGKRVMSVDDPNIKRGPEQIFFIAPANGVYRLDFTSKETGRYQVRIDSLRASTTADQKRIDAERTFIEGQKASASGDHPISAAKYEEALHLISGLGDDFGEAVILYNLGKTNNIQGDTAKALDHLRKSRALFQKAGSWDEMFANLGPLYMMMGGRQQAFDYLNDALPLVRALKNQRLEAILLSGLSKVKEDMGDQQQVLLYTLQALDLLRITGKRGAEVFTLTEIGDSDLSFEDKKKAIGYLNQALLLSQGASDKALEVSLLAGLGYLYDQTGEHESALKYFRQELPLWRGMKDKNGEAYALNFIGTTYFLLGDLPSARDHFEQAVVLFRQSGDRRAEAYAISSIGSVENNLGNTQKAFDLHQQALKTFQETGERHGEASTLSNLAEIYWKRGDRRRSLESYQRSLLLWKTENFREGEAVALSSLGFVHESNGETAKALDHHEQALRLFRLLGDTRGEAAALYGVSRLMYKTGNLDEALAKIRAAIALIEVIRGRLTSSDFRASYLATHQHLYQFYIELLMQIDKRRPSQGFDGLALHASESARARSLLDILTEAKADLRKDADKALIDAESAVRKQLNAKDNARRRTIDPLKIVTLDKEILALSIKYQDIQAEIKQKNPHYAALAQPQPSSLSDIQKMLDPDTLLLEYSLGIENSYLWVVSNSSIKSFRLPNRADIGVTARALYEAVKNPEADIVARKAGAELGKILIEPAIADLGTKRLAIVADGVLGYIPFAALTTGPTNTPLIADHELIYLPSASTLAALRDDDANRIRPPKSIAAIADAVFDENDSRVGRPGSPPPPPPSNAVTNATRDAGLPGSLPRLPSTRREAMNILSLVPEADRKQAIDFEASIATVTDPELAQYRIIHFATHGILNSVHPELSGIVLSLVDEKGKPQDGFLRLNDIYNLKLPADLIVLSACQTALGKEIKGEGLVGLTRGFMYAGSRRVVASQWAVDDQATSELMQLFYKGMLGDKKLRPAAALREAQISMSKNKRFANPYYWSAFTLQGEWR